MNDTNSMPDISTNMPATEQLAGYEHEYAGQAPINSWLCKQIALKQKQTMHLLFSSPVLANIYYIGGGSLGLVVLIVIIVLLSVNN